MAVDLTKLRLERIQRSGRLDDAGKSVSMIGRPPWFGASGGAQQKIVRLARLLRKLPYRQLALIVI
jgi:hypothetical protein